MNYKDIEKLVKDKRDFEAIAQSWKHKAESLEILGQSSKAASAIEVSKSFMRRAEAIIIPQ